MPPLRRRRILIMYCGLPSALSSEADYAISPNLERRISGFITSCAVRTFRVITALLRAETRNTVRTKEREKKNAHLGWSTPLLLTTFITSLRHNAYPVNSADDVSCRSLFIHSDACSMRSFESVGPWIVPFPPRRALTLSQ